jgi:hypothetical protein
MYTRYDYTTTALLQDMVMDVCKVIGGETNKANLSASCLQASTSIISTEASGWEFVTSSCEGRIGASAGANSCYVESAAGKIYRSNTTNSATVSVFPYVGAIADTNPTAQATITTSTNPTQMVINNSTNRLYIMCNLAVTVVDTTNNSVVATVTLPATGQSIAISTALNKIYVGDTTGINIIDGTNNSISKIVTTGVTAGTKMALNNTTGMLYWTNSNTLRKMVLATNTPSLVYTASSTLYDVAVDTTNNTYYTVGAFTEGNRVWGFDGATDTRQANDFMTPSQANCRLEIIPSTRVMVVGYTGMAGSAIRVYDIDSKTLLRTLTNSGALGIMSSLVDSVITSSSVAGSFDRRIDCMQSARSLTANMPVNVFRALNADGLTYKGLNIYQGTTTAITMICCEPYSLTARSLAYSAGSSTTISLALGGTLFIGSSNRYAFLSGWINGTFQSKVGIVERTRDSAWDTPAYGVTPVVSLTVDGLGTSTHTAPRVKTLAGADSTGNYNTVSLLNTGSADTMVLVPDANFVSKNPVVYLNFVQNSRGDLGGRALGLPITTAGLGTNLDEIIYNGNVYVMFVCNSSNNRVMVPKF